MRTYPTNSPQAAARILALTLVADGSVSQASFDVLDRIGACRTLGLSREQMRTVLQDFCDDLMEDRLPIWADTCEIDPAMLHALMSEVQDPALRVRVIRPCLALVDADGRVSSGESLVLVEAVEQWGLERYMLKAEAAA